VQPFAENAEAGQPSSKGEGDCEYAQYPHHFRMGLDGVQFDELLSQDRISRVLGTAGIVTPSDVKIIRLSAVLIESKIELGTCALADRGFA